MLNIQKQSGGKRNLSIEKHEFSIIFQWLQSLQIYPLCGCKDTQCFSISKKKTFTLPQHLTYFYHISTIRNAK